ncbi:unnamed protein product [Calypogeia fissa]
MTGANAISGTTCSVSGRWDHHVGRGGSFDSRSASTRATHARLSLLQSNCGAGGVSRCSILDPKGWNFAGLASRSLQIGNYSRWHRRYNRREAGKAKSRAVALEEKQDLQQAKLELLNELLETGRGLLTTTEQRAIVEEKLVAVEKFDAGTSLELDRLDGTWLLQYTTAPDVIQILRASETPFLQIGQIFQKFECAGRTDGGFVKNVVRWSIPGILQNDDGATLIVTAEFSVVSPRSIALSFEEAQLGQVQISEGLQGLLAPAFLPRTSLNLEVLQFFRTLNLRVPLIQTEVRKNIPRSAPVGLWYYLTYLDRDLLVGRALGSGGIFIFSRTQQLQLP